jgi:hypothetical protein
VRLGLILVCLLVPVLFPRPSSAQRPDLNNPVKIVVTSGAEDRNELASELVVMVYAAEENGERLVGAATIMGANRDCLYLATADHVARDEQGRPKILSVRTRWRVDATPVKVLELHDAGADLAALCLPKPDQVLVPFPRIPYFVRGEPTQLMAGDAITFFGAGNTFEWHTKSAAMTYADTKDNMIVVRGAGVDQGDSGGAVFAEQDVFNALVGMILRTDQGETFALSIDSVTQRFRDWRLPVNLESWNFRDANSVQSQENEEGSLQVGMVAPPVSGNNSERLKRLAVGVSGGPPGRTSGLLVGATDEAVWIQVPWKAPTRGAPPRLKFATGFEVSASYVPTEASGEESILTAAVPRPELVKLAVVLAPGFSLLPPVLNDSPLRIPFLSPGELVAGTTSFLLGVDSSGNWRISPRDLTIEATDDGKIKLNGGAIDPTWIGWLAFDDRTRLVGVVSGAHDSWFDLSPIRNLEGNTFLPSKAAHLRRWHPLNVPIQVLAGGADPHCPIAQAIGYGRQDEAADLMLIPEGLLIAGRAFTFDYSETEDFTLRLDRWPNITSVRRAQVPGQKGTLRLATAADQKNSFSIGQVRIPPDVKIPSSEPHWCGFIEEVRSTDNPTLKAPVLLCGGLSHFLPEVALGPVARNTVFAGGKVVGDRVVAPAALAKANFDGSVQELFADQTSVNFGGAARGADGSIYLAGYGANGVSSHPVVITKIGPDGKFAWNVTQSDEQIQFVRAITMMPDGSVVVVGQASTEANLYTPNLRIWKISSSGTLVWKRDFNLSVRTEVYNAISDAGQAIVVGEVEWPDSTGNVSEDGWILAIDGGGNLAWQQTYSAKYGLHHRTNRFRRLIRTPRGLVVLGEVGSSGLTGTVLWLVRLEANGTPLLSAGCKSN